MGARVSTATAINGYVPTITATGIGDELEPWSWALDANWVNEVAAIKDAVATLLLQVPSSEWIDVAAVINQGASLDISNTGYFKYAWITPSMVALNFELTMTDVGTSASPVKIELPITSVSGGVVAGGGMITDDSTTENHLGTWVNDSTGTDAINLQVDYSFASNYWGATPNLALAADDVLRGQLIYEPDV